MNRLKPSDIRQAQRFTRPVERLSELSEAEQVTRAGSKPPPTVGRRYRFTDFVGASFEATFAGHETVHDPEDGTCLLLHFADHGDFMTNLPIAYVEVPGERPTEAEQERRLEHAQDGREDAQREAADVEAEQA